MIVDRGYPSLAAFQASESSWTIYRGFSYLHARVLLDLQDGIEMLEQELELIDIENDLKDEPGCMVLKKPFTGDCDCPSRHDQNTNRDQRRAEVLEQLRIKIFEYDDRLKALRHREALRHAERMISPDSISLRLVRQILSVEVEDATPQRKDGVKLRRLTYWDWLARWVASFTLINTCHGRPIRGENNEVHRHWKERALDALTENLVSCANLLAPAVFLTLSTLAASRFHQKRREGRATLGMLGMAFIFSSMSESDDYMRPAVGVAYACFMAAYCRLVVRRNGWKQGYCALAAALASFMVIGAVSSTPVRTYLASLNLTSAALVLSLAVPVAVFMCDVATYLSNV